MTQSDDIAAKAPHGWWGDPVPLGSITSLDDSYTAWEKRLVRSIWRGHLAARQGHRCAYCNRWFGTGDAACTLDHVVPLRLGGPDALSNAVAACGGCNSHKHHGTRQQLMCSTQYLIFRAEAATQAIVDEEGLPAAMSTRHGDFRVVDIADGLALVECLVANTPRHVAGRRALMPVEQLRRK